MYAETGQACRNGGKYKCFGHPDNVIQLRENEIFPKCTIDKPHEALWIMVLEPGKQVPQENEG